MSTRLMALVVTLPLGLAACASDDAATTATTTAETSYAEPAADPAVPATAGLETSASVPTPNVELSTTDQSSFPEVSGNFESAFDSTREEIYRESAAPAVSDSYEVVVPRPRAETWDLFFKVLPSNRFFVRETYATTGVIVASFDTRNFDEYVDCGQFSVSQGDYRYEGPYARYLKQNTNTDFTGKMTVVLREAGAGETRVQVRARYDLASFGDSGSAGYVRNSWSFGTGERDTVSVQGAAPNANPERTCQPTHRAEKAVVSALKSL